MRADIITQAASNARHWQKGSVRDRTLEKEERERVKLVSKYNQSQSHLLRLGNEEEEPIHAAFSESELTSLRYINEARECIVSDVTRLLGVVPTTTTSLINRLEQKKLVSRKRTDRNRRIVLVSLTKAGKNVVREFEKEEDARSEKLLSYLTEQEQDVYIKIIEKLASMDRV